MTRRLVPSVTFLGQILKVNLSWSLGTILFFMTSRDLNIDLTQNKFHTNVVGLQTNYPTPFAVYRYDSWFSIFDVGPKRPPTARFRAFQSPPGMGLSHERSSKGHIFSVLRKLNIFSCRPGCDLGNLERRKKKRMIDNFILYSQCAVIFDFN